jgi:hypothetical protein
MNMSECCSHKRLNWAKASLIVLVLSALVHGLTFVPGVPVSMQLTWPLHIAAIVVFSSMIFSIRKTSPHAGPFRPWGSVPRHVPTAVILLCVALVVYSVVNFALFVERTKDGSPIEENGRYLLLRGGKESRELSREEYDQLSIYAVRGFSGHWMVFSLIPAIYFCYFDPRRAAARRDQSGGGA